MINSNLTFSQSTIINRFDLREFLFDGQDDSSHFYKVRYKPTPEMTEVTHRFKIGKLTAQKYSGTSDLNNYLKSELGQIMRTFNSTIFTDKEILATHELRTLTKKQLDVIESNDVNLLVDEIINHADFNEAQFEMGIIFKGVSYRSAFKLNKDYINQLKRADNLGFKTSNHILGQLASHVITAIYKVENTNLTLPEIQATYGK